MKRSSKTIETHNSDNLTFMKTSNKNLSGINNINNHSHNTTYKTNTQIRESIMSIHRINLDTDNSNSHEVSLNLSNFIIPTKKRSDRHSYTINSTNQPSMVNSNKNTDENVSTISYSNNNLYKTVNTQTNSGQTFKFEFSENNNQCEEMKLKELIKMKEKSIHILQNEFDKINKKVDEAKKTFNSNLMKYNCLKQSNDQLKKMICMMIVNKK
jgi:hypothetical protein